jgi:tRNA G18 (ribose-2'-O)-methylase SpoU
MSQPNIIQIESKNALLELLLDEREFERIYIASNAFKDKKTQEIVKLAQDRGIPIIKLEQVQRVL